MHLFWNHCTCHYLATGHLLVAVGTMTAAYERYVRSCHQVGAVCLVEELSEGVTSKHADRRSCRCLADKAVLMSCLKAPGACAHDHLHVDRIDVAKHGGNFCTEEVFPNVVLC